MGILSWLFGSHNSWEEISNKQIPRWFRRAMMSFEIKQKLRPYNKIVFFKGKTFRYKVWYQQGRLQGEIIKHIYRKVRK